MIRLAVRVQRAQAELVLAELLELAPEGVEEVSVDERVIEYAVYGAPGELPGLPDVTSAAGGALVEVSTSLLPDDWQERWKSFHRPVLIEAPEVRPSDKRARGARALPALHVRAPWQAPSTRGDVLEVVIDPGQAFGTGAHATTRQCLQLLLELASSEGPARPLLDVGTGSGVLAIAGARLGFSPVLGVDHDRLSIRAARSNAASNGQQVELRQLDLRRDPMPWIDGADESGLVVVANLLAPLLRELARAMTAAPAHLIVGGLLVAEADSLVSELDARFGLRERRRCADGEWCALWLGLQR